ncbi:sugar ABC transporter permease, partial [bacterium]|nr:sugar ABC transporter permease [bacterium]
MTVFSNIFNKHLTLKQRDARIGLLLIAPALIALFGVTLWPIVSNFVMSFLNAPTGVGQVRTFVGLDNYIQMVNDPAFWQTIGRTLYFTVASVVLNMLLGL